MLNKKYLTVSIACLAVIPAIWIAVNVINIRSHPATPEYKLELISKTQGWPLIDVQTRDKVWDELDSNKPVSIEDWQILSNAVEREMGDYGVSIIMMFAHHRIDSRFKDTMLTWSEKYMSQTNDVSAAGLGYLGYIRAGGPDKDIWHDRLVARGGLYPEEVQKQELKAEKISQKLESGNVPGK